MYGEESTILSRTEATYGLSPHDTAVARGGAKGRRGGENGSWSFR